MRVTNTINHGLAKLRLAKRVEIARRRLIKVLRRKHRLLDSQMAQIIDRLRDPRVS